MVKVEGSCCYNLYGRHTFKVSSLFKKHSYIFYNFSFSKFPLIPGVSPLKVENAHCVKRKNFFDKNIHVMFS